MAMKKMTITIDYEMGSDFQRRYAIESLRSFLEGWAMFYRRTHKKNKIWYEIKESKI